MKQAISSWLAAACALAFALPVTAQAQLPDHLECHKIKDSQRFTDARVNLSPTQIPPFTVAAGCKVVGKAKELCIPTQKTVTVAGTSEPPNLLPPTQELENDYLCYKVRCDRMLISSLIVTDQFGSRKVENVKAAGRLCVPAVKGVVTTTTTSTTSSTSTTSTTSTTRPTIACCQYSGEALCATMINSDPNRTLCEETGVVLDGKVCDGETGNCEVNYPSDVKGKCCESAWYGTIGCSEGPDVFESVCTTAPVSGTYSPLANCDYYGCTP